MTHDTKVKTAWAEVEGITTRLWGLEEDELVSFMAGPKFPL